MSFKRGSFIFIFVLYLLGLIGRAQFQILHVQMLIMFEFKKPWYVVVC